MKGKGFIRLIGIMLLVFSCMACNYEDNPFVEIKRHSGDLEAFLAKERPIVIKKQFQKKVRRINKGQKRTFQYIRPEEQSSLSVYEYEEFYLLRRVELDERGTIYLMGGDQQRILAVTSDFETKQWYGKGQGEGPCEWTNAYDIATSERRIFVSDFKQKKVSLIDKQTGHCVDVLMEGADKIGIIEGKWVVSTSSESDYLLATYNENGQLLRSYLDFIEDMPQSYGAMDGFMAQGSTHAYYSFLYAGFLVRFTPEGQIQYIVDTINHPGEMPGIGQYDVNGARITMLSHNSKLVSFGIAKMGDRLYNLAGYIYDEDGETIKETVLDGYIAKTGEYHSSYRINGEYDMITSNSTSILLGHGEEGQITLINHVVF
jgi:hypothetical protein